MARKQFIVFCPRDGKKFHSLGEYERHLGSKRVRHGDIYWTILTGDCGGAS